MTRVFVDTSALYAVLDADDRRHADAVAGWERLLDGLGAGGTEPVPHGSVAVESTALVQHRLGMAAVRALHYDLHALLRIRRVDEQLHGRAVAALLAAGRRDVSLVDWTSFEMMRGDAIEVAFSFDDDFAQQGFAAWS
ncbi:MAG TPA: PIN domain-containing protein [Acidimicrobiales bacterium]